ncbi:MAG: polysaccharide biosynthesis/export family protein [Myxococcota bacterium]
MVTLLVMMTLSSTPAIADGNPLSDVSTSASERYVMGAGDVIDVQVYREAELSGEYTISDDGLIDMPLLGAIQVAGLSMPDLSTRLTEKLAADYLVNPHVSVRVTAYNSQKVQVMGMVEKPGEYALSGPTTLLQLLAKAGDVKSERATHEVTIKNEGRPQDGSTVINLNTLRSTGQGNVLLRAGDIIFVAEGQIIRVDGQVNNPGSVPFQDGMTVLQALNDAGGTLRTANLKKAYIIRDDQRIRVNIKKILSDPQQDVSLEAGDLLQVPESIW